MWIKEQGDDATSDTGFLPINWLFKFINNTEQRSHTLSHLLPALSLLLCSKDLKHQDNLISTQNIQRSVHTDFYVELSEVDKTIPVENYNTHDSLIEPMIHYCVCSPLLAHPTRIVSHELETAV